VACGCSERAESVFRRLGFVDLGPSLWLVAPKGSIKVHTGHLKKHHLRLTVLACVAKLMLR